MKIRLLSPARINFNAGDVVDASPAQAGFLLSVGGAVLAEEKQGTTVETAVEAPTETPEETTTKKTRGAKRK